MKYNAASLTCIPPCKLSCSFQWYLWIWLFHGCNICLYYLILLTTIYSIRIWMNIKNHPWFSIIALIGSLARIIACYICSTKQFKWPWIPLINWIIGNALSEIGIKLRIFLFKKTHSKMSNAKLWPSQLVDKYMRMYKKTWELSPWKIGCDCPSFCYIVLLILQGHFQSDICRRSFKLQRVEYAIQI